MYHMGKTQKQRDLVSYSFEDALVNVSSENKPAVREIAVRPFLKWVGGKTQLLGQFSRFLPPRGSYSKYLEPFVGSGAVFFHLRPDEAHLADNNEELVNCYKQIQGHVEAVIEVLRSHKRFHSKRYYYKVRSLQPKELSFVERAARLIYLNKTCFNGLYRVNSRGGFNVPMGRYRNPPILDEHILQAVHSALKGAGLYCMEFWKFCDEFAEKGDFVYFDPPYFPLSKTANFTSYTAGAFKEEDQLRLRDIFEKLGRRGCFLMLSNSDTSFIRSAYKKYRKTTFKVSARRSINSSAKKRGPISELVILNYQPK